MIKATDPIIGPSRADPDKFLAVFVGPDATDRDYVVGVCHWAPVAGVDSACVLTQFCQECTEPGANSPATSYRWRHDRNPGGIGIPADSTPQPFVIPDGDSAARLHVQCLYSLVKHSLHPDVPLWAEATAWVDAVWLKKVTDPKAPQVATLADLNIRYQGSDGDSHATWAWDDQYLAGLLGYAAKWLSWVPDVPTSGGTPVEQLTMTPGLIPLPTTTNDFIDVSLRDQGDKCRGYDGLGDRPIPPKFLVLHRSQNGSGTSNSGWYHDVCCPALTDLEVNNETGEMRRFVDLRSGIAGWANGVVNAPYGDALAWLNQVGWDLNSVNRDGESCEITGWFVQPGAPESHEDPVSEACWATLAQWIASRAHDYGIAYSDFPYVIAEGGRSYATWHQEWTIGTGKVCPGRTVVDGTDALFARVREIMRVAQTGQVIVPSLPPPPPVAVGSAALYAKRYPPPAFTGSDEQVNGHQWRAIERTVTAIRETPRRQTASATAKLVGPPIPAGTKFKIAWQVSSPSGDYFVTPSGTRVAGVDCDPAVKFSDPA